ncbi:hypothetical protein T10_1124 [Trichinella papuae]|uniref:Uncharacterized protein n=1 Tax=Trichinella papuae TaxID=268474 RepID=A0A0V1MUA4_9BILA|nr:hypothetical protein T10_1124 [Trichinella papuae]
MYSTPFRVKWNFRLLCHMSINSDRLEVIARFPRKLPCSCVINGVYKYKNTNGMFPQNSNDLFIALIQNQY